MTGKTTAEFERAEQIRKHATELNYERAAHTALADAHECQAVGAYEAAQLHVAEAQVWATLHLARVTTRPPGN